MSAYLSYWQDFWSAHGNPRRITPLDWATESKSLYRSLQLGDTIWGVISGPKGHETEWRLLLKVVVKEKQEYQTAYGPYYITGDPRSSVVFDIDIQPDFAAIMWVLDFKTGRRLRFVGKKIGQALQARGGRKLAHRDLALLEEYAEALTEIAALK